MSDMPERVKRYDLVQKGTYDCHGEMEIDNEYGDWVKYDDYAALESRLLALYNERQGEVYELSGYGHHRWLTITLPNNYLKPGDRVRVTKVEEKAPICVHCGKHQERCEGGC